ncbi:MAG: L-histidine N(alpha)-methyltransferase [Henriciella sp.]|nr:L-histidine N(alpha)-methyltransferase [Henriciella sp.]
MTSIPAETLSQSIRADQTFLQSILTGLQAEQKTIDSKWLYDPKGSHLFDQITELDAYYPTRTEIEILERGLGELAPQIRPGTALMELGSGSSVKTRLVFEHIPGLSTYVPVDISESHLLAAAADLARDYPLIEMRPIVGDFTSDISLPKDLSNVPKLLFFPGSTIGNFEPEGAVELLTRCRQIERVDDFIVGFDLVKDPCTLVRAYDDELGVTAAFNLNLLVRINRELGADFETAAFRHEARWNKRDSRIEMHLVSKRSQTVGIAGKRIQFSQGETIHTENSHKYTTDRFSDLAGQAGWSVGEIWTDEQDLFAVALLKPE